MAFLFGFPLWYLTLIDFHKAHEHAGQTVFTVERRFFSFVRSHYELRTNSTRLKLDYNLKRYSKCNLLFLFTSISLVFSSLPLFAGATHSVPFSLPNDSNDSVVDFYRLPLMLAVNLYRLCRVV